MDEGKLFVNVRFVIAECDKPDEIRTLLINEGAKHINYLSEHVTHVISDRVCKDADEAVELYDKPVVKSIWVRRCLLTRRIWPPEAFSPFKTTFLDVVASFSKDLSENDARVLQGLITSNGGRLTRNLDASTHFIAPSAKPTEFPDQLPPEARFKIVSPDWVYDSVKRQKRCDESLYCPTLLLSPPPPPPPKQPTPPPPPQVSQPPPQPQPQQQQQQQQQMIESNGPKGSLQSDNNGRGQQINRPAVSEEQARKIDHFPAQIRTQTPPQMSQQSQVNTMQQLPQAQMTRAPVMMPNVIRGASPRFRPLLPPTNPRQQPTTRIIMTEPQARNRAPLEYNHAYRKVGPYPYNPDMPHTQQQPLQQQQQQQQQLQHPHPQSQGQPYQQVEHAQMHQHGAMMNQPMRMSQSNMYQQVRPNYQNSHIPSRVPVAHPNTMSPQQMQQQPVPRFQDPNSQIPRPYHPNAPHQQHQTVNPGYQQSNMQRQPVYYNQGANTQPMRMPQQGPVVRGTMLSNEHMIQSGDPHHRFPNQVQPQHQQIYQQQPQQQPHQRHQLQPQQQQAIQRMPLQKSQSFQQPHAPIVVSNQPQLQPNMPNSQIVRVQRHSVGNQSDNKMSNARQSSATQSNEKAPRAPRNPAPHQQPHPSIFDLKQESSYAQMKAKVPILADNVEYHNYAPDHVVPKGRPLFGCRFKLIEHDDLDPKIRQNYCDAIIEAGGVFEENIEDLTHLICESRTSPIFMNAIKKGVRCVTIYWINDVLGQDRLEYPWKALHIPTCYSKDDKHLRDQMISITNLRKQDRQYVKDMIKKTGATYTDFFSRKNTLLICGSPEGEKFEHAIEWGIPIANCLLIADYLISGRKFDQMLDHAKYQNFNRGDQLKLDSYDLIKDLMIPWTKPIPAVREIPNSNGMLSETLPASVSKNGVVTSGSNSDIDTNKSQSETAVSSNKVDIVDSKKSNDESVQNEDLKVPIGEQSQAEDSMTMEKSTIVNTSDTSANVNISAQSESNILSQMPPKDGKKSEGENESNHSQEDATKIVVRKSDTPVRVLFTRLKPTLHAELEKYAIELGFRVASSYADCTHLVVDRISRSRNFICAFSHASFILSHKWLLDSHKFGKPLDEMAYILQDKEGEKNFSFDLVHSLIKRKKRNQLLFRDIVFFVSPTPLDEVVNLREMIMSAGGEMASKKLPTGEQISQIRAQGKRFVIVAANQDLFLFNTIKSFGVDIVDFEFVLSGILRQDLDFDHHRLLHFPTNGHQKGLNNLTQPSPQKKIRHV